MAKARAKGARSATAAVRWKPEPQEHDYPAASSYLSLLADERVIAGIVQRLRAAPTSYYKAKDILRAARLELLPDSNPHVAADLAAIGRRERLSPILLVRGDLAHDHRLQVADGYHRVCASYHTDENTPIPCRITDVTLSAPATRARRDSSRAKVPARVSTRTRADKP